MKLLFSGADNYIVSQKDPNKSLGGQMSSTPIPNGRVNVLFNDISKYMKNGDKNTFAIFLYNDESNPISNLTIQSIYQNVRGVLKNECIFRFGVVEPSETGSIEIIGSSKEEPFYVDWFEPETRLEQAFIKFKSMPIVGEVMNFLGTEITSSGNNFSNLIEDFETAFKDNEDFEIFGFDFNTITIKRKKRIFNEIVDLTVSGSITLLYDITDFSGVDGRTLIAEEIPSGKAIGLWIQREFVPTKENETECLKVEDTNFLIEEDLDIIFEYEK